MTIPVLQIDNSELKGAILMSRKAFDDVVVALERAGVKVNFEPSEELRGQFFSRPKPKEAVSQ